MHKFSLFVANCHEMSRFKRGFASLWSPLLFKGLQHAALTDSDHRMNRCQEMLSQTFQPFWSFKSLPEHVWTCSWITSAWQGCTGVFDGLWYPCNQSRMGASCSEHALHCNLYGYIKQGDTDSRSPGTMNVQHRIFFLFFYVLCPFHTSALW